MSREIWCLRPLESCREYVEAALSIFQKELQVVKRQPVSRALMSGTVSPRKPSTSSLAEPVSSRLLTVGQFSTQLVLRAQRALAKCLLLAEVDSPFFILGFPQIRGTFSGVPIMRVAVYWGLYWGPPVLGNYHIEQSILLLIRYCPWKVWGLRKLSCMYQNSRHVVSWYAITVLEEQLDLRRKNMSVSAAEAVEELRDVLWPSSDSSRELKRALCENDGLHHLMY